MFYPVVVGMNPSKRDRWPVPTSYRHVWVRFGTTPQPPPFPGLVLDWRKAGEHWVAWVIYLDTTIRTEVRQGWLEAKYLRPAASDWNVWNDGPWR